MNYEILPIENGHATSAKGFKAAGTAAGIKKSGKPDLGILVSQVRCTAAGMFTTNRLKGASLRVTQEHLADGHAQALIVNSGNANACTSERGLVDAREMARCLARPLGIATQDVLPNSTGVIGIYLPLPLIREGIEKLIPRLRADGGLELAQAMMTTDTVPKTAARRVVVEGHAFTIGGCAKGAGMIMPNMATMLAFLTTDARISPSSLSWFLHEAVESSFNRLSIDGDTSCCDTAILMANGLSDSTDILPERDCVSKAFLAALKEVCLDLTHQLARDGEGVTKVVTVQVKGARAPDDALRVARSIANSPLVKTAIHGCDPNWGRLITAAGYSGAEFDPAQCALWIGDLQMMHRGQPAGFDEAAAHAFMQQPEYTITLDLGQGDHSDFYIMTDLSKAYIDINADYRHRT